MSAATVSSVLSARYPTQHGVRNNGSHFLSAKIETAAEAALRQGFRTSFYSGGAPLWRKSGINQGFEVFDDFVLPSLKSLYRPASENIRLFLSWQDAEVSKNRFFSILFLNDLQFPKTPTTNELGEIRESSYRSQLEELDESLGHLVKNMKQRKIWDNTHVFLVGVNSYSSESRKNEFISTNLFSERTHVAVMLKPARKVRETPFNWKIDTNVSLVDVGVTLFDLIGVPVEVGSGFLPVVSLKNVLSSPKPDWSDDRLILSESGWAEWRELGPIRYAARKGSFLYLHQIPMRFFNTLADRLEAAPLSEDDPRYGELKKDLAEPLYNRHYPLWPGIDLLVREKLELGEELWQGDLPRPETFEFLNLMLRKYPKDSQLRGWSAQWALRREQWSELKKIAEQPFESSWNFVAEKNLPETKTSSKTGSKPIVAPDDVCLKYLTVAASERAAVLRDCALPEVKELIASSDQGSPQRQRALETFSRLYKRKVTDGLIQELSYASGLTWDTPLALPNGPQVVDLILALPENKKLRASLGYRFSWENK